VALLEKKIEDTRFMSLIKAMLKAGYLEEWIFHATYSGVPQGSMCAPILANVYLHELDLFRNGVKERFDKGKRRGVNKTYVHYTYVIRRLRERWDTLKREEARKEALQEVEKEIKAVQRLRGCLPSGDPFDSEYKRLSFCRYADDVRHLTHNEILLAEKGGSEEETFGSSHLPRGESRRGKEHVREAGDA
jgi:RNA-directed DNA polymerase